MVANPNRDEEDEGMLLRKMEECYRDEEDGRMLQRRRRWRNATETEKMGRVKTTRY